MRSWNVLTQLEQGRLGVDQDVHPLGCDLIALRGQWFTTSHASLGFSRGPPEAWGQLEPQIKSVSKSSLG